ncbi:MAG: alpha/beta fold hydrolase [Gemmatimonadaceae bacterium]|nr:alpha/beta fold hydrolase [Acetobacteraceae bacterium]
MNVAFAPTAETNPEIGKTITAAGIQTNVHDVGEGHPVLMIHGSGPGVSAWSNWRLNMPVLAQTMRIVAPDCVGFGYTERPAGIRYDRDTWVRHLVGVMDELGIEQADIVGNSFGGSMALALAIHHPKRVRRMVLMGSVGLEFELTPGLDAVWGYQPSLENMRGLLDIFAYDRKLVTDELAMLRYRAASRPGIAEAFASMFPAPRSQGISALAHDEESIAKLENETLIVHGREDKVIPVSNAQRLFDLIPKAEMHLFGRSGHWTQIEHKDRFNALVANFLI